MNRILELRNSSKLSQADLAKFVGCTQVAISHYEKGQRKIPPEVIAKLCSAFGCSADYLLGLSDIKKTPVVYSNERTGLRLDGPDAQPSQDFIRIQRANKLFLSLDDAGKAQALAYLEFLEAQQSKAPEAQD